MEPDSLLPDIQELAPALRNWRHEALVFSTNFRLGFDVEEFKAILPKNLIHHVVEGEPIFDFFEGWKAAAAETSAMKIYGARQWFIAVAERMAERAMPLQPSVNGWPEDPNLEDGTLLIK